MELLGIQQVRWRESGWDSGMNWKGLGKDWFGGRKQSVALGMFSLLLRGVQIRYRAVQHTVLGLDIELWARETNQGALGSWIEAMAWGSK